jgi:hypothetical protein
MNFSAFLQRLPAARVLRKTKDSLVAVGAKDRFNQLIRPYGRVLEFQLNTQERTVHASFRLKGEIEAIQFWFHEYKLVENKRGQTFIVVDGKDIATSREWLTKLIGGQLGRQKILIHPLGISETRSTGQISIS